MDAGKSSDGRKMYFRTLDDSMRDALEANGAFSKLGVLFVGVSIIAPTVFWGLYWGSAIWGSCQIDSCKPEYHERHCPGIFQNAGPNYISECS